MKALGSSPRQLGGCAAALGLGVAAAVLFAALEDRSISANEPLEETFCEPARTGHSGAAVVDRGLDMGTEDSALGCKKGFCARSHFLCTMPLQHTGLNEPNGASLSLDLY